VALEEVAPYLQCLRDLEVHRVKQAATAGSCRGKQQGSAEATKQCLLAIGEHIEGGSAWASKAFTAESLWLCVAEVTSHRMSSNQMACLYRGLKQQGVQLQPLDAIIQEQPLGITGVYTRTP
jgi:hypothetical protein